MPDGNHDAKPDAHRARATAGETHAETILRPEVGLARGVWEAPVWTFSLVAALVSAGLALYLVHLVRSARAS